LKNRKGLPCDRGDAGGEAEGRTKPGPPRAGRVFVLMAASKHSFTPRGVCAKKIHFELEGDLLRRLRVQGGCPGNLEGLARLADGRPAGELIELLAGLTCGDKGTSCPDQLARALGRALKRKSRGR